MGNCGSVLTTVICLSLKKSESVRRSLSKGLNYLFQGKVELKFNEFSTPETIERDKIWRPLLGNLRTKSPLQLQRLNLFAYVKFLL